MNYLVGNLTVHHLLQVEHNYDCRFNKRAHVSLILPPLGTITTEAHKPLTNHTQQHTNHTPTTYQQHYLQYHNISKHTILHLTAKRRDIQAIKYTLESVKNEEFHAFLNLLELERTNRTPLYFAAWYGELECAKYIMDNLEPDRPIHPLDNFNLTLLHTALENCPQLTQLYRTATSRAITATSGTIFCICFVHVSIKKTVWQKPSSLSKQKVEESSRPT